MSASTAAERTRRSTAHASLAILGATLQQLDLFGPIRDGVRVAQKTVRHSPGDKLYDAFIALLAGAQGLVELNRRLRADPALQAAFGRAACAEQSVVQDTLDACTAENVAQMEQALGSIYRAQSRGFAHDYDQDWQILDVDMSGLPCGKKAALATTGYFAKQRRRRGRQLGRVLAALYQEVVVDQLFAGNVQLRAALQPLVLAAEQVLALDEARRQRTILRIDAGAGGVADINWVLQRGYQVVAKDCSTVRARRLAESVATWFADPRQTDRQVGRVVTPAPEYDTVPSQRAITRVAVRCRQASGDWGVGVVISTLPVAAALQLSGLAPVSATDPAAVALAYAYLYDLRSGGVETAFKGDKQGLGLTKRNKKRFEAQQMLVALTQLAHNVLIWARRWLAAHAPRLRAFGIKRLVRDVFGVHGTVESVNGRVLGVALNPVDPLAAYLLAALRAMAAATTVQIRLDET